MPVFSGAFAHFAFMLAATRAGESDEASLLNHRTMKHQLETRAQSVEIEDISHVMWQEIEENSSAVGKGMDAAMQTKNGHEGSVRRKSASEHPLADRFGLDATVNGKLGVCSVTRCFDDISPEVYFDAFVNHTLYGPAGFDLYTKVNISQIGRDCCGMGAGAERFLTESDGNVLQERMLECQPSSFFRFQVVSLPWPNHYINQYFKDASESSGKAKVCIQRDTAFGPTLLPHSAVCGTITKIQIRTMETIAAWIKNQSTPVTETCEE